MVDIKKEVGVGDSKRNRDDHQEIIKVIHFAKKNMINLGMKKI